jgi:TonB family protein
MVIDLKKAALIGTLILGVSAGSPQSIVSAQEQETARKTIKTVPPVYPVIAKKARLTGTVKLSVVVAPDGSVKSLKTVGGNPVLALAAEEAVKRWKFETLPKESVETIAVKFTSPE